MTPNLKPDAVQQQQVPSVGAIECRQALVALSLANLSFVSAWQRRIYGEPFFMPLWSWRDLAALLLNVILLGVCFYLFLGFAERHKIRGYRWNGLIYAIPLFAIMNLVRRTTFPFHHGQSTVVLMALAFVLLVLGLIFWQSKLLRPAEFVILGLVAALPLNIVNVGRVVRQTGIAPRLAPKLTARGRRERRVVWLVFDEMDYSLSFPRRPAYLQLPEFERLRSESLFATAAHQPGPGTELAMPTILTGRKINEVKASGTRSLRVKVSPGEPAFDLADAENVFTDIRAAHLNVGAVGWYLPYCRMFPSVISECHWEPIYTSVNDRPAFWTSLVDQWDALTLVESRVRDIQRLKRMVASAKTMAVDPELSLVFIHLAVPHGPPIYDRRSQRTTVLDLRKDWFFDNLLLTDRVLGEVRSAMEAAKQWDRSAVIVTSDHSLREYMMPHSHPTPLVPFIVKMPGQTTGTTFDVPFNTAITRKLIGAVMRGEVTDASLPEWLAQHGDTNAQDRDATAQ